MFFQTKWLKKPKRSLNCICNNKNSMKEFKKNVGGTIAIVVFVGAAIPGIKANSNDDLPQIEDEDHDAA